jgi:hypothetical protein
VAVVPVTADDPGGRTALDCAADVCRNTSPAKEAAS